MDRTDNFSALLIYMAKCSLKLIRCVREYQYLIYLASYGEPSKLGTCFGQCVVKGHSINTTRTEALKVTVDVCTYFLALLFWHRTGTSHIGATPATLVPDCENTRSRSRAFTSVAADVVPEEGTLVVTSHWESGSSLLLW